MSTTRELWPLKELAAAFCCFEDRILAVFQRLPHNVRFILQRHRSLSTSQNLPFVQVENEIDLCLAFRDVTGPGISDAALFHLARVCDEVWQFIFQNHTRASQSKSHDKRLLQRVFVDLGQLAKGVRSNPEKIDHEVKLQVMKYVPELHGADGEARVIASWQPVVAVDLSGLPALPSLSASLPGTNNTQPQVFTGIGTGGGSDIISASILGHLLRQAGREMDLLISTRSLLTGSQGKPGSKSIGSRREIYDHGGHAYDTHKQAVADTYRVLEKTASEGRDLETIPLPNHKQVWIVLDHGSDISTALEARHAHYERGSSTPPAPSIPTVPALKDQLYGVIDYYCRGNESGGRPIDTVLAVDTGGDVFGSLATLDPAWYPSGIEQATTPKFSTPDQDTRTILELCRSDRPGLNLVLAVLCPGLDSPPNLFRIAKALQAVRYIPNASDRKLMISLLTEQYHMDGTDESRFGKSSLCLLEALKRRDRLEESLTNQGESGVGKSTSQSAGSGEWVCLPLPPHVIQTRENPWGSFVWVTDTMAEIVILDARKLGSVINQLQPETKDA